MTHRCSAIASGIPGLALFLALTVLLSGCILPAQVTPRVGATLVGATKYMHRGMVQNDKDVAQGELKVDVPTADGGNLRVSSFGNMDLHNSTGDAWFPNGFGGKFSEIDFLAAYGRRIGAISATLGVVSYILPNGILFPNGERGTTTEFFLSGAGEVLGVTTEAELHYDWDEVDGYYAKLGVRKSFPIRAFSIDLGAHVGYSDGDHSLWTYGLDESGLADLAGGARVNYRYDDRTTIYTSVNASTILDDDLRDWFDLIGIDDDNLWFELGVDWKF